MTTMLPTVTMTKRSCGFCRGAVRFIIRHDPRARFRYAPLQSEVGQALVAACTAAPPDGTSLLLMDGAVCTARSDAALRIAAGLTWPWRLLRFLRVLPRPLREGVYGLIARHRHRLGAGAPPTIAGQPDWAERSI